MNRSNIFPTYVCYLVVLVILSSSATGLGDEVQWTGENGDWHVVENWTSDPDLPGVADDVIINVESGLRTITHSQGDDTVKSLTIHEALTHSGGTLEVQDGLTFAEFGRLSVPANGVSFSHAGPTVLGNADLRASSGGTIVLSGAQSYTPNANATIQVRADGLTSAVELPAVTTMSGNATFHRLFVDATSGGRVSIPSVQTINGGSASYLVEGIGSELDFSSLASIQASGTLTVRNGGRFTAPLLTTISDTRLDLDDTAAMATSQITSIVNGGVTARRGSPDFSGVTEFNNSGASAIDGAQLVLPNVTRHGVDVNRSAVLSAEGLGSELDLSTVTTFTGGTQRG